MTEGNWTCRQCGQPYFGDFCPTCQLIPVEKWIAQNPFTIGEMVIDAIVKGGFVRADSEEPLVLVWSANAPEQIGELILRLMERNRHVNAAEPAKEIGQ